MIGLKKGSPWEAAFLAQVATKTDEKKDKEVVVVVEVVLGVGGGRWGSH